MRASDALHLSTTPSRLYIQIVHVFVFLPLTRQSQCVLLTPYICQQHLADCTYVCVYVSPVRICCLCVYMCVYMCVLYAHVICVCICVCVPGMLVDFYIPVCIRCLCVYKCVRTRHACRLLHTCLHTLSVCVYMCVRTRHACRLLHFCLRKAILYIKLLYYT